MEKNKKMYTLNKNVKKKIDQEISRGARKLLRIPWLKKTKQKKLG